MNINGISGAGASQNTTGMSAGKSGQTDPVSKDLQRQIEKLQNDLKEVSANSEMTADAKMKKRQDIQKQISELQIQLRQHQMEAKREEREKKKEESSFDDLMGTKKQKNQSDNANAGISTNSMTAMISADVSIKQANVQGSTAQKMNGRANVLEAEIALDSSRNGSSNTGQKEAELADAREAAQKATSDQLSSLAKAGEELEKASEKENTENRTEDKEKADQSESGTEKDGEKQTENISGTPNGETSKEQETYNYHPVDVRL